MCRVAAGLRPNSFQKSLCETWSVHIRNNREITDQIIQCVVKSPDEDNRRLAMSLFLSLIVAAGKVSTVLSSQSPFCSFFLPLPSTHCLLSAAGGRSSLINNQSWSVRGCVLPSVSFNTSVMLCVFSSYFCCRRVHNPFIQGC